MKSKVVRVLGFLLGLIYFVFGLNFFLQFIPMPKPPAQPLIDLVTALVNTGYFMQVVKVTEIVAGALLLLNLFSPLMLVILAPITLNIFLIHAFLDPSGVAMGAVMVIIHVILGVLNLDKYKTMLQR